MAHAGEWFGNVKTKELAQLKVSPEETGGRRLEAELWLEPGGAVLGEHVHDHLHERFTVLDGELMVVLDGERSVAGPGTVVDVPPGRSHDWSNHGATVAHGLGHGGEVAALTQPREDQLDGWGRGGHL